MKKTGSFRHVLSDPGFGAAVAALLILLLLGFYALFVKNNLITKFDDAYMFIRYAKNMLAGYGIAWNPDGVQTYGATSLLYLLLIVLMCVMFPSAGGSVILVITSAGLAILSLAILAIGCARLSSSNFLRKFPIVIAFVLAVVFLLSPSFLFHATSGMDTALSLLCNSLLIFATLGWLKNGKPLLLLTVILTAYFSFLARPDNLIYALMFPVLCAALLPADDRKKKIIGFLAGLGLLLVMDTAIKFALFGDPLPLPFYAKTSGYYDGYIGAARWNPILYLFDFGRLVLPFMLIVIICATTQARRLLFVFFVPVLLTFAYYFSVTQIMGYSARYYFPSIPFWVVGSFLISDHRVQSREVWKNKNLRLIIAAALAIGLWMPMVRTSLGDAYDASFASPPHVYRSSVEYSTVSNQPLPKLGWWESISAISELTEKLSPGTTFALSEYGQVGAKSTHIQIVDMVGLNDPFFAHHGFSSDEFFSRKPELIWFPHSDYTKIVAAIQDAPQLWEQYDFYPTAFDYGLAIRRDAANELLTYAALEQVWQVYYPGLEIKLYLARR